jgi:hypothetical protein
MDVLVVQVEVVVDVLLGTGSEVSFSIEVGFRLPVVAGNESETPEIKFPSLVEQRVVDVLLKNHGPVAVATAIGLEQGPYPADVLLDFDTGAPVWIFSWFDDPNVFAVFIFAAFLLLTLIVLRELRILGVTLACFDVKGQRQRVENVLVLAAVSVVIPHVDE